MCRVLSVSRSGYYRWRCSGTCQRVREDERLLAEIKKVHSQSHETYGSVRVTDALHDQKIACGKNRVARLMSANGIRAKAAQKFKVTTDSKHSRPVHDNLLKQNFVATGPDERYVADITYIWTIEGWLYLSIVLDLYSRMIVGWSMSERMHDSLVIDAIDMAYRRRNPAIGALFHSDRGSQYASADVHSKLVVCGFVGSMSRKGNCYDNACAESFFHTLKTELVNHERYYTRQEALSSIFNYIEVFYNRVRKHSTLGYKSPEQFETLMLQQKMPA